MKGKCGNATDFRTHVIIPLHPSTSILFWQARPVPVVNRSHWWSPCSHLSARSTLSIFHILVKCLRTTCILSLQLDVSTYLVNTFWHVEISAVMYASKLKQQPEMELLPTDTVTGAYWGGCTNGILWPRGGHRNKLISSVDVVSEHLNNRSIRNAITYSIQFRIGSVTTRHNKPLTELLLKSVVNIRKKSYFALNLQERR